MTVEWRQQTAFLTFLHLIGLFKVQFPCVCFLNTHASLCFLHLSGIFCTQLISPPNAMAVANHPQRLFQDQGV
jgi:hypothetical protein